MSSKRVGVLLVVAFMVLTAVDLSAVDGLFTVDAKVVYDIVVANLTITAIAGIIIFLGIVIYKRIKK